MKSLTLVLLTLSIVCIVIGYMELKIESKRQKNNFDIEYRFVPREIYDSQFNQLDLENTFSDIFESKLLI